MGTEVKITQLKWWIRLLAASLVAWKVVQALWYYNDTPGMLAAVMNRLFHLERQQTACFNLIHAHLEKLTMLHQELATRDTDQKQWVRNTHEADLVKARELQEHAVLEAHKARALAAISGQKLGFDGGLKFGKVDRESSHCLQQDRVHDDLVFDASEKAHMLCCSGSPGETEAEKQDKDTVLTPTQGTVSNVHHELVTGEGTANEVLLGCDKPTDQAEVGRSKRRGEDLDAEHALATGKKIRRRCV